MCATRGRLGRREEGISMPAERKVCLDMESFIR